MPAKKKAAKKKVVKKQSRNPLTAKRIAFAFEYMVDKNAKAAAERAGFSKKTSKQIGSQLLKVPEIQAIIKSGLAKAAEEAGVDATYVLSKAVLYLETNITDFLVIPEEGSKANPYFDFSKATEDQLKIIDSIEISPSKFGTKIKVGLPKKKEMLDLIGRHVDIQAFKDKVEVNASKELLEFFGGIGKTIGPPSERSQ